MAIKKSMWILLGILVISAWVLGSPMQVGAEEMNYKNYTWVIKSERALVGDVEGHAMSLSVRKSFMVFENGEVATTSSVATGDYIKGSGPFMQYVTVTFGDGSTIVTKTQGTVEGTALAGSYTSARWSGEIINGTGRFEGIKGTVTSRGKYFPLEKDDAGPRGITEGTYNYTLPSK